MLETGDPAIKLFGKTISLPGNKEIAAFHGNSSRASANEESFDQTSDSPSTNLKENDAKGGGGEQTEEKESFHRIPTETKEKVGAPPLISEELTDRATFMRNNENTKTAHVEIEIAKINASMTEEAQIDVGDAQEKTTLKKPDKLLPCPRCNSMDTKFCYYNNYNVNQPRHFCKHCQRYWTAGGTMRNMAVGAGRRKNKNSASQYRHIIVSESLQTAQATAPDGIHHPALKPKGTILTFGSDAPPPCESMASALNLADKTTQNCTQNGVRRGGEVAEDKSKGSYVTASSSMEEGRGVGLPKQMMQNCHGFPPQIPFFPGPPPWPNPWNTPQWSSAVPPPGFCPTFPIPFYPTPTYWGSPVPGPWGVPWLPSPSSAPNHGGLASTSASGPNSPTLGKHSREGDMLKPSISENKDPLKQSNSETSIWIPKTLRIDDPSEAAKSSIWATLGIKRDKSDSSSSGGLLRPFESSSKSDEKSHMEETSKVLQANPAALSRSLNFHERW